MQDPHSDAAGDQTSSGRARPTTGRLALIGVAALAIAVVAYWFFFHGPGQGVTSPTGSTILELTGDGNAATEDFRVREGWSIHWENSGDRFTLAISGDRNFGTVVDQQEPGSGVTSPAGGGTYQIDVKAEGAWSLRVVQGE